MTQEEKDLLLKDLCARSPYGVKVNYERPDDGQHYTDTLEGIDEVYFCEEKNSNVVASVGGIGVYIDVCKPYLRPMSSMTEKERKEVEILIKENRPSPYGVINNKGIDNLLFSVSVTSGVLTDWLNSHHFNYRGLIEKGLALEAPEGMYEY